MKSLRSLLIIFCLLFAHTLAEAAVQCDDPDAPEQVRIYFANGMNNEPDEIEISKKKLAALVGPKSDRSFGKSINTKEGWYMELLEVYTQKESEPSKFWEWLANMSLAPQWFQDDFNTHMTLINNVSYAHDAELRTMVNEYLQDLNSGKKLVIVSHSQGNFYANAAYQYIKDNYPKYQNSIGIVAVGTPAARVQDGGQHTTNSLDQIVNLVRLRYDVLPATGTYDEPGSSLNHNFIGTYLEGFGTKIKNDIIATIARLETPEKDFECKKPIEVPPIVQTTGAFNISSTSAFLGGYVVSGKQIAGFCIWRKAAEGAPASCWDYHDRIPISGNLDTGDFFHCIVNGLSPNTEYNYRVCGRESGRLHEGLASRFKTNISCGTPLTANGSSEGLSVNFGMGAVAGDALVQFEAFNIPDKLEIWHGGIQIYSTDGYVSGLHSSNVYHDPVRGQEWEIRIYGSSNPNTEWELNISCPGKG